jgi:hypothetical protein
VVILNEDASGNIQHVQYPYTGKKSDGEIQQHLSQQPAGVVNLNPGTVTIGQPGIVSYQDDEPKVLYYFVNGEIARAFYGIDDDNVSYLFDLGGAAVAPGSAVTFTLTQESGQSDEVFYAVDAANFPIGGGGPGVCDVIQTSGTTPPLDALRRNGLWIRILP